MSVEERVHTCQSGTEDSPGSCVAEVEAHPIRLTADHRRGIRSLLHRILAASDRHRVGNLVAAEAGARHSPSYNCPVSTARLGTTSSVSSSLMKVAINTTPSSFMYEQHNRSPGAYRVRCELHSGRFRKHRDFVQVAFNWSRPSASAFRQNVLHALSDNSKASLLLPPAINAQEP